MPQKEIAGKTIDVDDEGYLTNHSQWTREVAVAIAQDHLMGFTQA